MEATSNATWLRVDTLLNVMPRVGKLIDIPLPPTTPVCSELITVMLIDTVASVCEMYNLITPKLVSAYDVLTWAMGEGEARGAFSALAFGHLARAATYCMTVADELKGYPKTQEHMFCAAYWAGKQFFDRYVLQHLEIGA